MPLPAMVHESSPGNKSSRIAQRVIPAAGFLPAQPWFSSATTPGHCSCDGGCPRCRPIQPKLKISAPDDPLELEADRIAGQVIAERADTSQPAVSKPAIAPGIQRVCQDGQCPSLNEEPEEEEESIQLKSLDKSFALPDSNSNSLAPLNQGAPLPQAMRDFYEPRFGYDFSCVRLHTDAQSAESADRIRAKAFTMGNHVIFGSDYYQPNSPDGRTLLAHELTHIIQQQGGELGKISDAHGLCVQGDWLDYFVEPADRQFAEDLLASAQPPMSLVGEILFGEIWDAICEHWLQFTLVTGGLITTEVVIGILAGAPTGVSQVIAGILEALVIAILGYFAAVEISGVVEEADNWVRLAREAHGDPERITEASRAFLRMVRHIIMTILLVAGIRTRVSSLAGRVPVPSVETMAGRMSGGGGSGGGGMLNFAPADGPMLFESPGIDPGVPTRVPPPWTPPVEAPTVPPPIRTPVIRPPTPTPEPVTPPTGLTSSTLASSTAAGISATTSTETDSERRRRRDCGPLPISWPGELPVPEDITLQRVRGAERDWENLAPRGRHQRYLAEQIRRARESTDVVEQYEAEEYVSEHCCFDYEPYEEYDAHHIQPLYLGGEDYPENLCALRHDPNHIEGHPRLDDQTEWIDTYRQCGLASGYLHNHDDYTEYYIAGMK